MGNQRQETKSVFCFCIYINERCVQVESICGRTSTIVPSMISGLSLFFKLLFNRLFFFFLISFEARQRLAQEKEKVMIDTQPLGSFLPKVPAEKVEQTRSRIQEINFQPCISSTIHTHSPHLKFCHIRNKKLRKTFWYLFKTFH